MTGRFLIMLVVLTAVMTTGEKGLAQVQAQERVPVEPVRSSLLSKRTVKLARSMTTSALLHRIVFQINPAQSRAPLPLDTHPVCQELPSPFRYCLPPPMMI